MEKLQGIIAEVEQLLSSTAVLPDRRRERCVELLHSASALIDEMQGGAGPPRPQDDLNRQFHEAHLDGMASLKAGDYEALGGAIAREREVIDEQARQIENRAARRDVPRRSPGDPEQNES